MIDDSDFERLIAATRPRLHRFCARLTGSAFDGEDVVQEVLVKAMTARSAGHEIDNFEGWLFRAARNAGIDLLRARARSNVTPLSDDVELASEDPDPDIATVGFRTFLELPVLQRCAVILKDVLGYSVEEVADIAECTAPAAKSALQRGRARLKALAAEGLDGARLPLLSDDERRRLQRYVALFRSGELDAIRAMLAQDIRIDLVNRQKLDGRSAASRYFTGYAQAGHWRFALGAVEGRAGMLVFDARAPGTPPAHFVAVRWRGGEIVAIRDFLFAPYFMEGLDCMRLE